MKRKMIKCLTATVATMVLFQGVPVLAEEVNENQVISESNETQVNNEVNENQVVSESNEA